MNLLNARLAPPPLPLPRTNDLCCWCVADEEGTDVDDLVLADGSKLATREGGSGEGEVAGVAMPEHSFESPALVVPVLVVMDTSPPD